MLQDEQFRGGVGRGVAVLAQRYTELAVKDGGFILTTWYCKRKQIIVVEICNGVGTGSSH